MNKKTIKRCQWAASAGDLDIHYHDTEWGVPSADDNHLFEMLILEGAQAGLSWTTVLKKREHYRKVYKGFDPAKVARFGEKQQQTLLQDPGIIRNRLKVAASVANAQAFLEVQKEYGRFADYIWGFVESKPLQNRWRELQDLPAETGASKAMSKDLKKRGFRFVGPTICYAFMQAAGLVNDHELSCFRHDGIKKLGQAFSL